MMSQSLSTFPSVFSRKDHGGIAGLLPLSSVVYIKSWKINFYTSQSLSNHVLNVGARSSRGAFMQCWISMGPEGAGELQSTLWRRVRPFQGKPLTAINSSSQISEVGQGRSLRDGTDLLNTYWTVCKLGNQLLFKLLLIHFLNWGIGLFYSSYINLVN